MERGHRAHFDAIARLASVIVIGLLFRRELARGNQPACPAEEILHARAFRLLDEKDPAGYRIAVVILPDI